MYIDCNNYLKLTYARQKTSLSKTLAVGLLKERGEGRIEFTARLMYWLVKEEICLSLFL